MFSTKEIRRRIGVGQSQEEEQGQEQQHAGTSIAMASMLSMLLQGRSSPRASRMPL